MSKQNPVILYIGSEANSEAFIAPSNWIIYAANELMDALARSVFDYPDAIIIDAKDDMLLAQDAYFHLLTVDYPPIVILSDTVGRWNIDGDSVHILPESSTDTDIAHAIHALLAIEPTIA